MRVRKEIRRKQEFLEEIVMSCKSKRFATILLAVALSAGMVSAVLAEGGKQQKKKNLSFTAAGSVVSFDLDASTLTLKIDKIDKANRLLKGQPGNEFPFAVSGHVKVKTEGSDVGSFDLSFEDIIDFDYVRVLGKKLADGTYLITHIVVYLDE
jgi:hypothetical protein